MSLHPFTAALPARHGFFTRQGGVSTGAYNSLNCSLSGADALANVLQNRRLVAENLGIPPENLLGVKQIHGIGVITATTAWPIGQGSEADALVTATRGLAIGVITADCAPVLFSNPEGSIIGVAHAGWRGAVLGVLEATAAAMQKLGATTIIAAVGPCIQQQSYEVAADLHDAVLAQNPDAGKFFSQGRPARWQFDLPGYCAARLGAIGITTEVMAHDTCADEINFFSHRRRTLRNERAIGHQISVIRT